MTSYALNDSAGNCATMDDENANQFASLKPSRSVDFATIAIRSRSSCSKLNSAAHVASQYSLRASQDQSTTSSQSIPMMKDNISISKLRLSRTSSMERFDQYTSECLDEQRAAATASVRLPAPSSWVEGTSNHHEIHADSWATLFRKIVPMRTLTLGMLLVAIFSSKTSKAHYPIDAPAASSSPRSSISLGSAAISSVTEALSPILPFTGGLDLRREDYWVNRGNWWELLQGVAVQVQDAFSAHDDVVVDETEAVSTPDAAARVEKQNKAKRKKGTGNYISAISAQNPFVSLDVIAELTMGEVAETFRFATESSTKGFDVKRFINKASPRVRPVIQKMQEAVARSRGKSAVDAEILPSKSATDDSFGQIDVLKFSAAMRIFAEWRVLRQVPEGYKGYAVGMSLGHKDIVQNLAKIEQAVHSWIEHQQDLRSLASEYETNGSDGEACPLNGLESDSELRSPTLHELLQHEIEMDEHPRLPRLKEKSAAMGLLWVRRQLEYQLRLVANILEVPTKYSSTRDAVSAAYKQVYDPFHGWPVQKIFNYSFQAAPDAEVIFRHMNPHRLKEVKELANRKIRSNNDSSGDSNNNNNNNESNQGEPENPWDHVVRFVVNVFQPKDSQESGASSQGNGNSSADAIAAVEAFVSQEMLRDAHAHITDFLQHVNPVLEDVEVLFDRLNMDDPTRV